MVVLLKVLVDSLVKCLLERSFLLDKDYISITPDQSGSNKSLINHEVEQKTGRGFYLCVGSRFIKIIVGLYS